MTESDCLEQSLGTLPVPTRKPSAFTRSASPWVETFGRAQIAAMVPAVLSYVAREARPRCRGSRGGRGGCRGGAVAAGMEDSPPQITELVSSSEWDGLGSFQLYVIATGTSPLSYQWYEGDSGDTGNPIEAGASAQLEVTPSSTTNYWVRISNDLGAVDSETVTVTCTEPFIEAQSDSQESPSAGSPVDLWVQAVGPSLSYEWFEGEVGVLDNSIGEGDGAGNITVFPDVTTSYWCRVSNPFGNDDSAGITVTVPEG